MVYNLWTFLKSLLAESRGIWTTFQMFYNVLRVFNVIISYWHTILIEFKWIHDSGCSRVSEFYLWTCFWCQPYFQASCLATFGVFWSPYTFDSRMTDAPQPTHWLNGTADRCVSGGTPILLFSCPHVSDPALDILIYLICDLYFCRYLSCSIIFQM